MGYQVTLTEQQINDIADVLANVWERKRAGPRGIRLTEDKLEDFECNWMLKALQQLQENDFYINNAQKNTFKWIVDQIVYTKVDLIPGAWKVDKVKDLCNAAGGGESVWRTYQRYGGEERREILRRLFE